MASGKKASSSSSTRDGGDAAEFKKVKDLRDLMLKNMLGTSDHETTQDLQ